MAGQFGISIIIDSYNHQRFVAATIESALSQDHDRVQVIVIDDGSPDGSRKIVESFGSKIQAVFQENQGQVAACRNVLPLAKHDIVIILDSDDCLDRDAARVIAAAWRQGVAKIQYSLRVTDEHGNAVGSIFPRYSRTLTPEAVRAETLRTGSYPDSPTSGNAFNRHFLETALPLLPRRNGLDGELNGIAPLYGDVLTIAEPLGSYRIHGDNDFSQNRLAVDRFEHYLKHSEQRLAFVREHYRSKGFTIEPDALDNDVKYLEYRLVTERLGGASTGRAPRLWEAARLTIRAAWRSPHALSQRLLRIGWVCAVAVLPTRLATFLTEQRFVPSKRLNWIKHLTGLRTAFRKKPSVLSKTAQDLDRSDPSSSHV
ncbi:MAG: glycosyltransferase family 2 protein [Geminicoccaceae bacterium]